MPTFEYAEWDGSQEFRTLSADMAFDKLADYLLEHGEYVLRQLEQLERDDADILKLLIKQGYLEKDEKRSSPSPPRESGASRKRPSTSCLPSPRRTLSANTRPISRDRARFATRTASLTNMAIRSPI